ncbi:hypothetical protein Tco_0955665 [Tanacetum coccineum]|uniref:Uncharacterized protein n=1 Tax=Tanacetum coccineum TaxID=301880 RepID=A0ABQ5E7U3_9ASTR
MGDEHLDTIPATESDEFIKSSVEILVPIPNQSEDFSDSNVDSTSTDEDSFSSNDIEYVEASPPNSEPVSSKETNTFDNSLPESETFYFNLEEISSGSPTTHSDLSLPDYDCFFKDEPEAGQLHNGMCGKIFQKRDQEFMCLMVCPPLSRFSYLLVKILLAIVVMGIFLPFLFHSRYPPYLSPVGMKTPICIPAFQKYHSLGRMYLIEWKLS